MQCLDVLRAMARSPEVVQAYFDEVGRARGAHRLLDQRVDELQQALQDPSDLEYRARSLVDGLALTLQAALLAQHAPPAVADAFVASRLAGDGQRQYGTLPRGVDCAALIRRATPLAS